MNVTQQWLEKKVKELNEWLQNNQGDFDVITDYNITVKSRNYYVNKLIELEENQLDTIKV